MDFGVAGLVAVVVVGGLGELAAGFPANDRDDGVCDTAAGVLEGGFDVAAGGVAGRCTGKSCSSNRSPLEVKMNTVAF